MEDKSLLTDEQIALALKSLDGWTRDGIWLTKDFVFANFKEINAFLPHMTRVITAQNHHPDVEFRPGQKRCSFRTSTHSAGQITQADLDLARALNDWR